jgi:tripartite-type tricarboxylate transporter receptor subunit TctC
MSSELIRAEPQRPLPRLRGREQAQCAAPPSDTLKHMRRSFVQSMLALLTSAVLAAAGAHAAWAQGLSNKPIRLIVGLSAGGATDVMARLMAQKMTENMRTTVFVENKVGGNFIPALRELTSAAPDGHTLFFISTSALITQPLHPDYPFDLSRLTPVTQVATGPLILVARNGVAIKSVRELIDYATSNPDKLRFGVGGGTGSSLYLATELLKARTGIRVTIVPYRGAAPALNDLLGDHIDAMFDAMPVMVTQAKAGKVTPLAVTGAKRSPALPDVPTILEAGVNYQIAGWFGILAPTGTPEPVVKRLRDEVAKALAAPDVVAQLDGQGMAPVGSEPEAWRAYLQSELATYAKIIKDANIKP